MKEKVMKLHGYRFAIDTKPFCVWTWDFRAESLRAVKQLDPLYFRYVAETHQAGLSGPDHHRAALALRTGYAHALESFFALLCAAIQAPECPMAWLLRYEVKDLRSVVEKLRTGRRVLTRLMIESSFESVAEAMFTFVKPPRDTIVPAFGQLWRRFAGDFLDDTSIQEYNSVKHGFRVGTGGCALAAGIEETPGVAAPPEAMQLVGGSTYGSSFYTAASLSAKGHLGLKRMNRNWNPIDCANGLELLSASLTNVQTFLLRIAGGDRERTQTFRWPEHDEGFDGPWRRTPDLFKLGVEFPIPEDAIKAFTPAEILAVYNQ